MLSQKTQHETGLFMVELYIAAVDADPSPFHVPSIHLRTDLGTFAIEITWEKEDADKVLTQHAEFTVCHAGGAWEMTLGYRPFLGYCEIYHNYDRADPDWSSLMSLTVNDPNADVESQMIEMVTFGKQMIWSQATPV